jgi:hypothetical protein
MNIVKNRLYNKIEDEFLIDSFIVYIKREYFEKFSTNSIIDNFRDLKKLTYKENLRQCRQR